MVLVDLELEQTMTMSKPTIVFIENNDKLFNKSKIVAWKKKNGTGVLEMVEVRKMPILVEKGLVKMESKEKQQNQKFLLCDEVDKEKQKRTNY